METAQGHKTTGWQDTQDRIGVLWVPFLDALASLEFLSVSHSVSNVFIKGTEFIQIGQSVINQSSVSHQSVIGQSSVSHLI